jgi:aspartate aminotransferase-like enzyme
VVVLSEKATEEIAQVDYSGYDALKPFATALRDRYMPYTHNWHNIAALHRSLQLINEEGVEQFRKRHNDAAALCRKLLQELGLRLVPHPDRYSPTVTAAYLPDGVDWKRFDTEMRKRSVLLGGSYGPLSGRVLRVGHMGSQARIDLVQGACNEIADVLRKLAN